MRTVSQFLREKILKILFLWISFSVYLQAENPIKTQTTITHVTVYREGAKVVCGATANVPAGNSKVVLEGISQYADPQSLSITLEGGGTLLSATLQRHFQQATAKPLLVVMLNDSISLIQKQLNLQVAERDVLSEEISYLKKYMEKLGSQNQLNTVVTTTEMQTAVAFYQKHAIEIRTRLIEMEGKIQKLDLLRTELQNRLYQLQLPQSDKTSMDVLLNITTNSAVTLRIKCSYGVANVYWKPIYDLHYLGHDKPLNLSYKASIYQNTDYDWDNIHLSVATGNLLQNNSRPILNPSYIDFQYSEYKLPPQPVAPPSSNMAYESRDGAYIPPPSYTVNVVDNQLNATFDIQARQDVPSDNNEHIVLLVDYLINADYQYHSVPKLDNGAYLLAQVSEWGQYNLLVGEANLFVEDTYIGKSQITPNVSSDTLLLSLGRDERINIKRVQLNEHCKTRFLGTNKEQTFAYEIMIRNNKSATIDLEILDQVPISRNSEIKVELEEKSGAQYLEEYGKILWQLHLKAGETKKLKLIYTIKSPKDKVLTNQ